MDKRGRFSLSSGNYDDMMASKSILDNTSTFGEALEKSGFKGDRKYRISPDKYQYMFETHIEQGPILEDAGNDIGVVDCVLGMFNYRVKFYGQMRSLRRHRHSVISMKKLIS